MNQVFNIGGDKDYSVKELATEVMKVMKLEQPIRFLEARNEVQHAYSDHSKLKSVFSINDNNFTSLSSGLQKMVTWAKTAGVKKSKKFENIEITEKLPKIWLED